MDLFEKIRNNRGPLGKHAKDAHGYFTFPNWKVIFLVI